MTYSATKGIWALALAAIAATGCESLSSLAGGTKGLSATAMQGGYDTGHYGNPHSVAATVGNVKLQGNKQRVSSMAIRLPERALGEIAVYGYRYPSNCGGHEFRVYEVQETQILEYRYDDRDGRSHVIRDYVAGANPFVRPGLWTAYDHTEDSISTMTAKVEQRGDKMFDGVYSQGLVTGLPSGEQRLLGSAYEDALAEVSGCGYSSSVAKALAD
jgi:hypothetical protein